MIIYYEIKSITSPFLEKILNNFTLLYSVMPSNSVSKYNAKAKVLTIMLAATVSGTNIICVKNRPTYFYVQLLPKLSVV